MTSLLFQSVCQREVAQVNQTSHTGNWLYDQKITYRVLQLLSVPHSYVFNAHTVIHLLDTIICSQ